jgi:hypothetical protein
MKKNFKHIESIGLPGGPNEQFTYITGMFSIDGYKSDSPDVNNPFNIIPSADITMEGVDFPVRGYGNNGIVKDMKPGEKNINYGDADYVVEVPMAKRGGGLLTKTMKCNSCGWKWKAADGGNDLTTCHKCGGEALPIAQDGGKVKVPDITVDKIKEKLKFERSYQDKDFKDLEIKDVDDEYVSFSFGKNNYTYPVDWFMKEVRNKIPTPTKLNSAKLTPLTVSNSIETSQINVPRIPTSYEAIITPDANMANPNPSWMSKEMKVEGDENRMRELMRMFGDSRSRDIQINPKYKNGGVPIAQSGKEQPTISQYEEPAWYEKALDYLASPMTAFGYSARNQDLPDSIPINAENRNAFDGVIDAINPFAWAKYAASAKRNAEEGEYLDAGFDALGAIPIVPAWLSKGKNVAKNAPLDKLDELVEVVTGDGSIKKIPKKDAVRLNRVEDANVSNTSFSNYEDGNWFNDKLSKFYIDKTKDAMSQADFIEVLEPAAPRRLITAYFDPADAKNFNLYTGTATERALNMSGGMGNMPISSEYVLPPPLVKQIRETGKIPGASAFIGNADEVLKNLSDFYKKYGGDISDLDKAQLGAFLKKLKPAIKKGANYIDEFIQNDLYKYNPWAYNNINSKLPEFLQFNKENEKWLRQVGEPAIRDAQATRTVREMGEEISPRVFAEKLAELQNLQPGMFQLSKRYPGPFFKKGETFFDYNKKSKSGLDGKRNTRGRSGSADYLIEFDPSDPIKYQGMDSYFQPAYMQNMMVDPTPMNKWVGDIGIMKPKMRNVENFNFYKKDPFFAYRKVPLDKLQEGGQAPFDKESWEYYRQQNPEAVMNPPVNDSVVIPPKDGFTKQEFIENLAKPKPEFQKAKTLNFNNILDYVVDTRGGTKELWGKAADTIAFHESGPWARMDPKAKQYLGGPGRGLFQFEPPSLKTAQKRYTNIAKSKGFTPNPDILNAKSADELNAQDQYTLFFANLIESDAKLADYAEGKMKLEDLWLKGHKNVESQGDRNSFLESFNAAEKEGIEGGYSSFEGGGELTLYDIYKKYVMGGATDDTSKSIYDKLNRVHYTDAKGLGMSVPNYILTYVMKSS